MSLWQHQGRLMYGTTNISRPATAGTTSLRLSWHVLAGVRPLFVPRESVASNLQKPAAPSKQRPVISRVQLVNSRVQLAQFTCFRYVNSRDSVDKFGVSTRVYCSWNHEFFHSWKTRVFCTCIHLIAVREFTGFCRQIWCVDTCLLLVKSRVFPFVKNTCFLHVYSPDCRTWIHGILSTNLVCRHVFTAREITSFSISEKHVFSARVFTWLPYVNSRDSVNKFGVSTRVYCSWNHEFFHSWESRVFCTCIHLIVVREFTGFYEHIWCIDTWLRH